MFKLDDNFWESIGGNGFSAEQRREFEAEVKGEVELRIGSEISRDMTRAQLDEFDKIIDDDGSFNEWWLRQHHPDYKNGKYYNTLKSKGYKGANLIREVTSGLWLHKNKPDFGRIADECSEEVLQEIILHFGRHKNK